jgi:uncharacterized hydrophobic protein (TIGR00271 family)
MKVEGDRKLPIYQATFDSADFTSLSYWLELFLSAGIATLGLVQNSAAVIIGAMLVSPLMGPIIATGLALALGDFYLGLKALLNIVASVLAAVFFAASIVWLLPFQSVTPEILARTQPNLLDLAIAILSGLAGAIVVCRGGAGGGVTALPGVAIAVALMPPLCVVGFGIGAGLDWPIIGGGGLLFLTNLVAIVGASFVTFFVVRMDAPETRGQINRWLEDQERDEPLYNFVQHTAFRLLLGRVGTLPRRALILFVFLITIFVPLRSGLERVRAETMVRGVVRSEIRRVFGEGDVVYQQVDPGPPVRVRVVATKAPEPEAQEQLQREIAARTGQSVDLSVREVASREDVAALGRRIAALPVTVTELEGARRQLLETLESALAASWPTTAAPLVDYSLNLRPAGLELNVTCLAGEPLGAAAEEAIRRGIEARLGSRLAMVFSRLEPRRDLLRWTPALVRLPESLTATLQEVAGVLRRHTSLGCSVVAPERARPELAAALAKEMERAAFPAGRCLTEKAENRDPWFFVRLVRVDGGVRNSTLAGRDPGGDR